MSPLNIDQSTRPREDVEKLGLETSEASDCAQFGPRASGDRMESLGLVRAIVYIQAVCHEYGVVPQVSVFN